MSTPENFTPRNIEREKVRNKKEVLRARNFRALAAGAFLTVGGLVGFGTNKYIENEHLESEAAMSTTNVEDMNDYQLSVYFKSNVDDTVKANYAATIILDEMNHNKEYEEGVALNSGTNVLGGNPRLDISRDFLTKFINTHKGIKIKDKMQILWNPNNTKYTRSILVEILSATTK